MATNYKEIKVLVTEDQLKAFQHLLIEERISVSEKVRGWIENYLLKSNTQNLNKIEELMIKDPKPTTEEGVELNKLVDKVVKLEEVLYPSLEKTEKIVNKVKKAEYCPHLIMVGGNCWKCIGGIAK